jgi:Tfp pilus assembly major pilin PilA
MDKSMHSPKQKGFTLVGLIIILGFIGIITLSVLKVFPVYMEHLAVQTAMESIEVDQDLKKMTVGQIRSLFEKKLDVNQVTSVNSKAAKISRSLSDITMKVEYEVRKDYFGNVDIVMSFSDQFEVPL